MRAQSESGMRKESGARRESFLRPRRALGGRTRDQISWRLVYARWKASSIGVMSVRLSGGAGVVEVGVREGEGLEHWGEVGAAVGGSGVVGKGAEGWEGSATLPEGGFGFDVSEKGAGDLGEESVEVNGVG